MVRLGIYLKEKMTGFTDGLSVRGGEKREWFIGLWFEQLVCGGRRPRVEWGSGMYLEQKFCFCRGACFIDNG